jgi:hypothetical protein
MTETPLEGKEMVGAGGRYMLANICSPVKAEATIGHLLRGEVAEWSKALAC